MKGEISPVYMSHFISIQLIYYVIGEFIFLFQSGFIGCECKNKFNKIKDLLDTSWTKWGKKKR